jgi:hypothetical protein
MKASEINSKDTKWVFIKKGTCSRTLFYILNREFGHPLENEEQAADPLCGGIMQQGYQCGLLFGATLAVGAESSRRRDELGPAIGLAIKATQHVMDSFKERAGSPDCLDITEADFSSKGGLAKFMVTGKFVTCFKLADKWAPEAISSAKDALSGKSLAFNQQPLSCASEVVKAMGATREEMVMVAGFAGGMGLSGGGCGALSAAIWMNSLKWCRENPGKSAYPNPRATETLDAFFKAADYEFECPKICGERFKTIDDHSEFIKNGGCSELIDALAQS